jgi:hypothetical protein
MTAHAPIITRAKHGYRWRCACGFNAFGRWALTEARTAYARHATFGRNAHAGVWIDDETADRISKDGP